jgi:hypothetical protein
MAWRDGGEVERHAQVVLNANGAGNVLFAVPHANCRWIIESIVCSISGGGNQMPYPDASVHEGDVETSAALVAGRSWAGQQQTFTGRFVMDDGIDMMVRFGGQNPGVPGTVATAKIHGKLELWV